MLWLGLSALSTSCREDKVRLYSEYAPSVVLIDVADRTCTGTVIDLGLVTEEHCLDKKLTIAGAPATVIRHSNGFALLSTALPPAAKPIPVGCGIAFPGEEIVALGRPWGGPLIITFGHIAGPDKDQDDWHYDIRVTPGMSGGPIIDERGRLISLVRSIHADVEGIGQITVGGAPGALCNWLYGPRP